LVAYHIHNIKLSPFMVKDPTPYTLTCL